MTVRKFVHNAWEYLYEVSAYVTAIALIVLAVIDISSINEWKIPIEEKRHIPIGKIFYYLAVLISAIVSWLSVEKSKSLKKLEQDVTSKGDKIVDLESSLNEVVNDMNDLFNSYLNLLIANLEFTHTERISVYKMVDDEFILIGRNSRDPVLSKIRRPKYPADQGFIAKAWREGVYFVNDLPDPESKSGEYYKRVNSIYQIEKATIAEMKMKSRSFLIYRLDGYNQAPKAVVVLESTREQAFKQEEMMGKLNDVKDTLVMFIEKNNGVTSSYNTIGL